MVFCHVVKSGLLRSSNLVGTTPGKLPGKFMNYCRASFEIVTRIRQMAPLLYIINFSKLRFRVKNEKTLTSAQNCVELSSISGVRSYITERPRFLAHPVYSCYLTDTKIPMVMMNRNHLWQLVNNCDYFPEQHWRPEPSTNFHAIMAIVQSTSMSQTCSQTDRRTTASRRLTALCVATRGKIRVADNRKPKLSNVKSSTLPTGSIYDN